MAPSHQAVVKQAEGTAVPSITRIPFGTRKPRRPRNRDWPSMDRNRLLIASGQPEFLFPSCQQLPHVCARPVASSPLCLFFIWGTAGIWLATTGRRPLADLVLVSYNRRSHLAFPPSSNPLSLTYPSRTDSERAMSWGLLVSTVRWRLLMKLSCLELMISQAASLPPLLHSLYLQPCRPTTLSPLLITHMPLTCSMLDPLT